MGVELCGSKVVLTQDEVWFCSVWYLDVEVKFDNSDNIILLRESDLVSKLFY